MKTRFSNSKRVALATVFGLFAVWGLAQWIYAVLLPQFVSFFQLDSVMTARTQAVFNISYFLLAIPAALFHRTFGYKIGVIFALAVFSLGPFLLYPAITEHGYAFFLIALAVMGASWAFLETSLNPLAVELGGRKNAVQRLNLAQAFYPVGLVAGTYIANALIQNSWQLTGGALAEAIARPYVWVGLGVLMLAFAVEKVGPPTLASEREHKTARAGVELRAVMAVPLVRLGAAALFFNVLAQSITWGVTFSYAMQELPGATPVIAGSMITWSCIILGAGRFVGTALMSWITPHRLLAACAIASLIAVVGAAALTGTAGLALLMGASFFMSVMYATIFANSILGLGALTKSGSGVLVAGAGAAAGISPFLMEAALKNLSVHTVCLLAVPSFLAILAFAIKARRAAPPHRAEAPEPVLAA